mmetsp:Transcript_22229/g.30992  ORF Transcript_22229/g.30992 Transcript_22229/m.30992 type:complete len:357 (-) Transcript_22229:177-1247(-)
MKSFVESFTLAVSVQNFFKLVLSESSSVKQNFHASLGDYELCASDWIKVNDLRCKRTFRFKRLTSTNPVITKIMGQSVEVEEVLLYWYLSPGELKLESQSFVAGSISSAFNSTATWTILAEGKQNCKCTVEVTNSCKAEKLPFYLRSFESVLENFMHEEAVVAYQKYITAILETINNHAQSETQLQSHLEPEQTTFESSSQRDIGPTTPDESDTEDEYFDAEEAGDTSQDTSSPGVVKYLQKLCNDMDALKEKLRQTQERLFSLENRTLQSIQNVHNTVNTGYSQITNLTQKSETQNFKDNSAVLQKLEAIDNTLHSAIIPRMIWGKNISFFFFLAVWPWIAFRAWSLVRGFVFKK